LQEAEANNGGFAGRVGKLARQYKKLGKQRTQYKNSVR
jgi:hypothetical protein